MPVRWGVHQIPQINLDLNLSRCRLALLPAVLSAARIWPGVSRYLEVSFGLRGPFPQAFTPFRGGLGSSPGAWGAYNKGNADGAEGIFGQTPGACGLRLCARSYPKKGLVPYMPVRWGVHSNTADQSRSAHIHVPGSTSAGCVICSTDLTECVSVLGDFLQPQGFYPLRGCCVYRPAPEAPLIRGMPTGPWAFLGMPGACGLRPCARTHLKKGLVPYLHVRWSEQQLPQINIGLHLSRCRVTLRPAVLSAARIWPSVSRNLEISFGFRGPSPQAFTPFGGFH